MRYRFFEIDIRWLNFYFFLHLFYNTFSIVFYIRS